MSTTKVVILAGGKGTRFWPMSRIDRPKQFLSISANGDSLITATAKRILPLCGKENLMIITNELHENLIRHHVPEAEILTEPVGRNTAAAIGLAAVHVQAADDDAVMVSLPADHAVADEEVLRQTLQRAISVASSRDLLVTIGIAPSFPNTAYGYIQKGREIEEGCYSVARFYEKPNQMRAQQYFDSGDYYWNSGMFVWKARVFLQDLKEFLPEMYAGLMEIKGALGSDKEEEVTRTVFEQLESISVDFGVLEHARNCAVITAEDFGWNDVGSWDAWAEHFETDSAGNLLKGDALTIDSKHCVVNSSSRLVAVLGARDLIVIDTEDALLICPRERVQDVRLIVEKLKSQGREELT